MKKLDVECVAEVQDKNVRASSHLLFVHSFISALFY